jgi:hypothetical protein
VSGAEWEVKSKAIYSVGKLTMRIAFLCLMTALLTGCGGGANKGVEKPENPPEKPSSNLVSS